MGANLCPRPLVWTAACPGFVRGSLAQMLAECVYGYLNGTKIIVKIIQFQIFPSLLVIPSRLQTLTMGNLDKLYSLPEAHPFTSKIR